MATVKYLAEDKDGNKKWLGIYVAELINRLRRDKNLDDVANKAEARKNLELTGEVPDHWHDARYIPMIEAIKGDMSNLSDEVMAAVNDLLEKLKQQLAEYKEKITVLENKCVALENQNDLLAKKIIINQDNIAVLKSRLDDLFDKEGRLTYPNGDKLWIK